MNFGGVIHINKTSVCIIIGVICLLLLYSYSGNNESTRSYSRKSNLKSFLKVALRAAENGGKLVVAMKDSLEVKSKGKTKEGMQDSVTSADFQSHCAMTNTIKEFFSNVKIISEETFQCENGQKENILDYKLFDLPDVLVEEDDLTVWIDPLDATQEYTEKLYQYVTTMVCVAVKGKPVIGVIHNPFTKHTSWGWVGKGVSADLLNIEYKTSPSPLRIIVSRSHKGSVIDTLKTNFPDVNVTTAAGAGYKVLQVAKGNVDAYIHTTAIKKWDICAGNAIIEALNGKMTTKYGDPIDYTDETNVKNENGLIVTIRNHDVFVGKL